MEKFLVSTLVKGKYFSHPLYLDDKYILLSPETPVSDQMIDRLSRWNYQYVHSHGDQIDGIVSESSGMEASINLDTEMRERTEFSKAFKIYQDIVNQTEELFADFINKSVLSVSRVTDIVRMIIDGVKENKQYMLRLTEFFLEDKNYLVVHSIRASLLSVALGLNFKIPNHKLIELGMATVLHEIGMIKLPTQLYMSNKVLTPQEKKALTAHTVLGFKLLKNANFPMPVCIAVLESHENVDGTGYPRSITGDKISLYGKIITIASSYAALSSPRPFRHAIDGHQSVVEILKGMGKRYDEQIVRAMVIMLSIYPIGTFVQLSNGSIGMVIQANEMNAKEPFVKMMISPNSEKLPDSIIVRTDAMEHRIIKALSVQQTQELKKVHNL